MIEIRTVESMLKQSNCVFFFSPNLYSKKVMNKPVSETQLFFSWPYGLKLASY